MAAKFQDQLLETRTRLGLNRAQVAKVLGVLPPRINEWENGIRTPKPLKQAGIMMRLAKAGGAGKGTRRKQVRA